VRGFLFQLQNFRQFNNSRGGGKVKGATVGARDCREEGLAETGSQRTQSFHPETGIHLT